MEIIKNLTLETFRLLKKDFRIVAITTWRFLVRNQWKALMTLLAVSLISFFVVFPYDRPVIDWIEANRSESLTRLSFSLGWWGDFAQFNLIGFLLIWIAGALWRSRWVQRLAVVSLYSAMIAGLTVNALRFTTGRARPYAGVEDKFYGIPGVLKGWKYHGFPSGHTSTALGMGSSIATAAGVYGLPVLAFSTSIAWSRIYRIRHFPTDVLVGGTFGAIFGVAAGWHLRKVRLRVNRNKRRKKKLRTEQGKAGKIKELSAEQTST